MTNGAVNRSGPCPICGENRHVWGHVYADSIAFHTRDTGILQWHWGRFKSKLKARKCERRKNVQLFAD